MGLLATSRPIFERATAAPGGAAAPAAPAGGCPVAAADAHLLSADTAAAASHLAALLAAGEAEINGARARVRGMLAAAPPERVEAVRAAMRLRGAGLDALLDQTMATAP